ncbi:MAG: hypothetical protein U5J95_03725 [Balneolaceae bacterium]|nr:hypothetical protein [Balneolaceae bacterium]
MQDWNSYIFSEVSFEEKAMAVFEYQRQHNEVYGRFCQALGVEPDHTFDIPLLPIQAFKEAQITMQPDPDPEIIFQSSGTSGMNRSKHLVADTNLYRKSILNGFNQFYDLDQSVILAYTPGYADNPHSSLIWMLNELIAQDDIGLSRFLSLDKPLEQATVEEIEASGRRLILFGAAFGLLDLAESSTVSLPNNSTVIETGGMKTHRREMSREEMHHILADGFDLANDRIHSEYGMAELLSQAYATGGKWFRSVPWMKVTIRDPDDPMKQLPPFYEGLIGVVDLANVHSCPFILTGDKGVMDKKDRFQVLGRWNPKDLRGCNFLIDED